MGDDDPTPSATPVADVLGKRVREVRWGQRRMTQQQLSERLAELGAPLHPTAVTKLERGDRQVAVDELLALALALNVSPLDLLTPDELTAWVRVGSEQVSARKLRAWVRGEAPWFAADEGDHRAAERAYHEAKPPEEYRQWEASHHRAVEAAQLLASYARDVAAGDQLTDLADPLTLRHQLDQALRAVNRHVKAMRDDLIDLLGDDRSDADADVPSPYPVLDASSTEDDPGTKEG